MAKKNRKAGKIIKSFFSSLKEKVKTNQITVINASVTVILIGVVITVLLSRASALQRKTAEDSAINLAGIIANEVQNHYMTYFDIVRTTSQIMKNYKNVQTEQRRAFLDEVMLQIIVSNRTMMNIYTIWKPNELDGMDAFYANTEGTDETGQFISGFTKERGWVEQRAFPEFRFLLDIDYHELNLLNGIFREPMPRTGGFRNYWLVDVQIPILVDNVIVGIIGMTIDLEILQYLVETRMTYGTGRVMVCTNMGTLVAHSDSQLRGTSFMAAGVYQDELEPLLAISVRGDVIGLITNSIITVRPIASRIQDTLLVSYPLRTIDPVRMGYTNDSGLPRWAVVTAIPLPIIMASINDLLRFSIFFIIGAAVLMVFVVLATSKSLTQHAQNLQRSLEHSSTMQDNLKYGLFLMDQKQIIQGAYSKALEKILSVSNLQGKNFLELINDSVKEHERQGVLDYIEMVYNNAFDKDMLNSINPISDFVYVSTETGEAKNLRTSFTLAGEGRAAYVLGTMEDITAEKELEKQLLEAESQRENEMRSLFQVIQLDPKVLSDFVADAEFEFENINEMLKNKKHLQREVLVEMYQAVHAVKSNALILNLEDFSNRLHKLESSVKDLQEKYKDEIPFDDFLGLILQINDAFKEMDRLKSTVLKIENFKNVSGGDKNQEQYVLVETLTRVCSKTQDALDKKVRFVVEGIDESVLDYAPRRAIKEVLTQLVRNAVYHGIESPEKREAQGKKPEGEIRLSIRYRDSQIIIKLTDNGGGINFDRIQKRAIANNLLRNSSDANDKNMLLKALFSPGFSTLDSADLHGGRGIGLSLVKDRIKDLRGNITVSTATGKGTTFTISIPFELPAANAS
ncbi:MAG: hypothetical protein LBH42_06525 [Treponema sp.]|jgi:two-component system chemotaxis sensor kinase CheA|nr:hypothetical protein [Treponema sp.]